METLGRFRRLQLEGVTVYELKTDCQACQGYHTTPRVVLCQALYLLQEWHFQAANESTDVRRELNTSMTSESGNRGKRSQTLLSSL